MISACSSLSTTFLKYISASGIGDGYDDLFFIGIQRNCGIRDIIKISVTFLLCNHEY